MCDDRKRLLNIAAIVDAFHDFNKQYYDKKKPIKKLTREEIKRDIDVGIKIEDCVGLNDMALFNKYDINPENIFLKDCIEYNGDFNNIEELVKNVKKSYLGLSVKTVRDRYNIEILKKNDEIVYFNKDKPLNNLTEDDIINFIGSKNLNIVPDGSVIRFFKCIEDTFKDTGLDKLKIHMIINRERVNDPASRPTSDLDYIKSMYDVRQTDVVYDTNTEFNTKYKLILKPLTPTNNFKIKPSSVFEIKDGDNILCSSDGNYRAFASHICAIKISKEPNIKKKSAYYQGKRAGDWLQALSCLYKYREYKTEDGPIEELDQIILLTSDRILLAYSLIIGIHILFLTDSNILLYFKPLLQLKAVSRVHNTKRERPPQNSNNEESNNNSNVEEVNKYSNVRNLRDDPAILEMFENEKILYINYLKKEDELALSKSSQRDAIRSNAYDKYSDARNVRIAFVNTLLEEEYANKLNDMLTSELTSLVEKKRKEKRAKRGGGSSPLETRLQAYYKELAETIEGFDNDDDLDYAFYENVACTVIACAKVFQPDDLESIFFNTLPSVEGYIRTDNKNLVKFFKDDAYNADCTSFAARQIALGSIGLRTGTLKSLSKKHVDIYPKALGAYNAVHSALTKSFKQRQEYIIQKINSIQVVVEQPSQPVRNSNNRRTVRARRTPVNHRTRRVHSRTG